MFDGADILSQVPTFNGKLLDVSGEEVSHPMPLSFWVLTSTLQVPALAAMAVASDSIEVPALSYGFVVLHSTSSACQ